MKKSIVLLLAMALLAGSCGEYDIPGKEKEEGYKVSFTKKEVARILSELPLQKEQLEEVYDAVNSSTGNGYDEEYTLTNLFLSPGRGVGGGATRSSSYETPIRALFEDYFSQKYATKAGTASIQAYIDALAASGMQIYAPYSEDWDGSTFPIITYDPGYGAETNYGYELRLEDGELTVVDSVFVDEAVAARRPVWVINDNTDSAFTPAELFLSGTKARTGGEGKVGHQLILKNFKMLRNYDTWFAGGSEFKIQMGAVDGFTASTEAELRLYNPSITEFILVVKRKQLNMPLPYNAVILTDLTDQMEKLAFLITEEDGGTRTNWKCSASVKVQSKSYGFDIDLPYNDRDDIVWRGQLATSYFTGKETVKGRFGDVEITFGLE